DLRSAGNCSMRSGAGSRPRSCGWLTSAPRVADGPRSPRTWEAPRRPAASSYRAPSSGCPRSLAWTGRRMKTIEQSPDPAPGVAPAGAVVSALEAIGGGGEQPDLRAFLAARGGPALALDQLLAVLRVAQRRRWLAGHRIDVRSYPRDFPAVAADPE